MTTKQTTFNGEHLTDKIVKLTRTAGGYYLRVSNPKADYYRVFETSSGRLAFIPLLSDTEEE
jgi:hypothetical protein